MDIKVDHVSKAYGEQQVLRDLSCVFPEGKTTCIRGRSGCGKTTLIRSEERRVGKECRSRWSPYH